MAIAHRTRVTIASVEDQERTSMTIATAMRRTRGALGTVGLSIAAATLCLSSPSFAQPYPVRPIRIIAPYTPGSPNDVMARLLAQHLQAALAQPIVIDNRPGGGTTIGTKAVAMAAPDGYTLLFSSSSLVIDPALSGKTEYDPLKDFAPIATVTTTSWILAVAPELPARSLQEFVAHAKANPGKLAFGFAQGTASQLVGERFKVLTATDIVSVPYKGGAAALPDFLGGRIQMLLPTPATTLPLVRDGKMRALAITSPGRSPDLPDVPTMIECGLGELTLDFWAGMLAPAGTPADVVDKLNAAINDSLRSPEMKASMGKLGFEAKIGSPREFAAFIAEELPRWGRIVKSSGVKTD
jgi:tripartite-type tricarboxylate transporter receptor subunit TctC